MKATFLPSQLFRSEMSFPGSCLLAGAELASVDTWFHGRKGSGLLFSTYL